MLMIYFFYSMADMETSVPPSSNPTPPPSGQDFVGKVKSIIQKLSKNEKAMSGGALVVIISSFLPAYSFSTAYYQYSVNNLYSSLGWLNFLAAVIVLLLTVLPYFNVKIPSLPLPTQQILLIASAVAAVCSVIQTFTFIFDGSSTAGNPAFGIFLVLAGSLLMAYTAYNEQKSHGPTQTPPTSTPTTNNG